MAALGKEKAKRGRPRKKEQSVCKVEAKREMDLAADIAFQQYFRPLELDFLRLKLELSFKSLAIADLDGMINALYDSADSLLSERIDRINAIIS
jgi:hypothetical protein